MKIYTDDLFSVLDQLRRENHGDLARLVMVSMAIGEVKTNYVQAYLTKELLIPTMEDILDELEDRRTQQREELEQPVELPLTTSYKAPLRPLPGPTGGFLSDLDDDKDDTEEDDDDIEDDEDEEEDDIIGEILRMEPDELCKELGTDIRPLSAITIVNKITQISETSSPFREQLKLLVRTSRLLTTAKKIEVLGLLV